MAFTCMTKKNVDFFIIIFSTKISSVIKHSVSCDLWTKFLQVLTLQTIAEQILFEIAQNTGHNERTHNWKCWQ